MKKKKWEKEREKEEGERKKERGRIGEKRKGEREGEMKEGGRTKVRKGGKISPRQVAMRTGRKLDTGCRICTLCEKLSVEILYY